MTLESGGTILADARGYTTRMGPGAGGYGNWTQGSGGGGHGGIGGLGAGPGGTAGKVYGSFVEPVDPGSGGGHHTAGTTGYGGGVVRIEAAGAVTIDGTISANGGNGSASPSAGAGGSIYITCDSFGGGPSGVLRANGGQVSGTAGGGGGGGRIAVHYDTVSALVGVRYEAAGGKGYIADRSDLNAAQMGTLYLSGTNVLTDIWRDQIQGAVLHVPGFNTWTSAVTVSNAFIGLPDGFDFKGTSITIAPACGLFLGAHQDVTLSALTVMSNALFRLGTNSVLTYAGDLELLDNTVLRMLAQGRLTGSGRIRIAKANVVLETSMALTTGGDLVLDQGHLVMGPVMHCGGDLRLVNGASLTVYSGPTNAGMAFSGTLGVTGDVVVGSSCWVYPHADPRNGGTVQFAMNSLTVETNAGFNADARGYTVQHGPGRGGYGNWGNGSGGGGYGGTGGLGAGPGGTAGKVYGAAAAPIAPGSSGGHYTSSSSGYGGGSVRIDARGRVTLHGTISANGGNGSATPAAGSGGSIYITCGGLFGTAGAVLRANGGSAAGTTGGGGGGGRIAVWVDVPDMIRDRYLAGIPGRVRRQPAHRAYFGSMTVNPGPGWKNPDDPDSAQPGTAYFFTYPHGSLLVVR